MPVNVDVLQIVRILNEEGFGALAGELLMEISMGRELDLGGSGDTVKENFRSSVDDFLLDPKPRREPIPDNEQLGEVVQFLRLRLVEPVRRLAEAERIASELLRGGFSERELGGTAAKMLTTAISISFVDPWGESVTGFARSEAAGEEQRAKELDEVLGRIAVQVG